MNKEIFRLVFGCSLTIAAALAAAQANSSRGGSGGASHASGGASGGSAGGGYRSSGGGGYSGGGTRSSGPSGYQGGSRGTGGYPGGGSSGGGYSGGYRSSGSGGSYGSTRSYESGGRYQNSNSRSGVQTDTGSSRYSRGANSGRYLGESSGRSEGSTRSSTTSTSRYSRSSGSNSSNYSNRYSGGYSSRGSAGGGYSPHGSSGGDNGFTRGHSESSRNGGNHYTGNNNLTGNAHGGAAMEHIGRAPHGVLGGSTLGHVIGNDGRHGGWREDCRRGYYGYWGGWRDSFFACGFYVFDPFFAPCYVSPWYYYSCLPGYVAAPNVIIVDRWPSTNWSGSDYDWQPASRNSTNPVLDDSIQDIVGAFETDNHKLLDRLVPHSGNVNIYVDGKYSYSLKANDFYDTYVDGIESTKTERYEILDVKANNDGTARVNAKHVYNDPSGNKTYVYHSYFLVKEGDEYVIREFGTSDYRTGW